MSGRYSVSSGLRVLERSRRKKEVGWGHSGKGPAEEHREAGCLFGQGLGVAGTLPGV